MTFEERDICRQTGLQNGLFWFGVLVLLLLIAYFVVRKVVSYALSFV